MTDEAQRLERVVPAWLRRTEAEQRLPMALAVLVAIGVQWALPQRFALYPSWLLPALELVLLAGLIVENPVRLSRQHTAGRYASLALVAAMTAANCVSAGLLTYRIVDGHQADDAGALLATGAAIYVTNIVAFALWYWELDRGGPYSRAQALRATPDFLFPQMTAVRLYPDWEPQFVDYLYVSFTNVTAFSPTDTMPMSRWTKGLMLVQSAIALITVGLVLARAVNVLR